MRRILSSGMASGNARQLSAKEVDMKQDRTHSHRIQNQVDLSSALSSFPTKRPWQAPTIERLEIFDTKIGERDGGDGETLS